MPCVNSRHPGDARVKAGSDPGAARSLPEAPGVAPAAELCSNLGFDFRVPEELPKPSPDAPGSGHPTLDLFH